MKCEEIQKELKAFLDNDMDDEKKREIKNHLEQCPKCSRELTEYKSLSGVLRSWKGIELTPHSFEKLESRVESSESFWRKVFTHSFLKKAAFQFAVVVVVVGMTLAISQWLGKPAPATGDDMATINLYLTEHQGAILKTVSEELAPQTRTRISVPPEDLLYYEHIDGFPRYTRPGIIFRGPAKTPRRILAPEVPSISKGKILDLPQAQNAVDFEPIAPVRLHPGYILDSIRKIEGYNTLHLIYTNGINTLSLFEQSLDGKRGLGAQDFREYAVYRNIETDEFPGITSDKGTILAWRNGSVSFVMIGKEDMSRLMDLAQAVSAESKNSHGMHD
jgi:hypothetical protein